MSAGQIRNVITWFELPATDFGRATAFYEGLFGVSLQKENMGPNQLGVFPYKAANDEGAEKAVSGCVIAGPGYAPGRDGAVVYLSAPDNIDALLARVPGCGGAVALGKVALPPGMGFFAHIIDTEGNRVGIHGMA